MSVDRIFLASLFLVAQALLMAPFAVSQNQSPLATSQNSDQSSKLSFPFDGKTAKFDRIDFFGKKEAEFFIRSDRESNKVTHSQYGEKSIDDFHKEVTGVTRTVVTGDKFDMTLRWKNLSGWLGRTVGKAKVGEQEVTVTPAGKFNTHKIVFEGSYYFDAGPNTGSSTYTFWYSNELSAYVKMTQEDANNRTYNYSVILVSLE